MARATTPTLLSLDAFAKVIGFHPLHFNQVYVDDLAPAVTCSEPLLQYPWQNSERLGREDIASFIAQAEELLRTYLNFDVAPAWNVDERLDFPRPFNANLTSVLGRNIRGRNSSIKLDKGYVLYGGREAISLIEAGVSIVYSDTDNDGYFETATVTVNTTVTETEEIALFYPGESTDDFWKIRPITVTIANGIATIVCRREQLVLNNLIEGFEVSGINGTDDDAFLTTVDIYRIYLNTVDPIQFLWENTPCTCGNNCTLTVQAGCMQVRNERQGIISTSPGSYDADEVFTASHFTGCIAPDRLRVWYRAGWMNKSRSVTRMDAIWERAVAYLALSLVDRSFCSCPIVERQLSHWRADLAEDSSNESSTTSFQLSESTLKNPLGTTRGAIYAWRLIQRYALGEAVANV